MGRRDPRTRSAAPRRRSGASRPRRCSSGTCVGVREEDPREHDRRRALGRDRDRAGSRSIGFGETSWIESTAPSEETQSRGRSRSCAAFRAHSIDGIGATSTSPASSLRASSVGTPGHLLDLGLEPVEDRRHVHVRDAAESDHRAHDPLEVLARELGTPLTAPLPLRLRAHPRVSVSRCVPTLHQSSQRRSSL